MPGRRLERDGNGTPLESIPSCKLPRNNAEAINQLPEFGHKFDLQIVHVKQSNTV